VKPGCILRRSNFAVLEREELVTGKQVRRHACTLSIALLRETPAR
jgi:hypothetical protein